MDLLKNSLVTGGCCCWLSWGNGCWEWRPQGIADRNLSAAENSTTQVQKITCVV